MFNFTESIADLNQRLAAVEKRLAAMEERDFESEARTAAMIAEMEEKQTADMQQMFAALDKLSRVVEGMQRSADRDGKQPVNPNPPVMPTPPSTAYEELQLVSASMKPNLNDEESIIISVVDVEVVNEAGLLLDKHDFVFNESKHEEVDSEIDLSLFDGQFFCTPPVRRNANELTICSLSTGKPPPLPPEITRHLLKCSESQLEITTDFDPQLSVECHCDEYGVNVLAQLLVDGLMLDSFVDPNGSKAYGCLGAVEVKLCDFGVSGCMFNNGDKQMPRNTFTGTPCLVVPEVMQHLHGYDFKENIWSFGITTLELSHGHAPFSKYPPMKVLLMTLQNAPPGPYYDREKKISKSLNDLVLTCLLRDPMKRPISKKLLHYGFFKLACSNDYLVQTILDSLPSLGYTHTTLKEKEASILQNQAATSDSEQLPQREYLWGISTWNFNFNDLRREATFNEETDIVTSKCDMSETSIEKDDRIISLVAPATVDYDSDHDVGSAEALHPYSFYDEVGGCSNVCVDDMDQCDSQHSRTSVLKKLASSVIDDDRSKIFGESVDKLTFECRTTFTKGHIYDIFYSADRPAKENRWRLKDEDPFQCLDVCINLAVEASKIAATYSEVFTATILDVEQCKEMKMGSYLGVATASAHSPYFTHLSYKPPSGPINTKLALVGKGLTFDSGGYNIKTRHGCLIELMKFDMGGSAAMLGAAKAIGQIKLQGVEFHFITAACENMTSGTDMRHGDIVTTSNGNTIEVNNSNAEGRLTLADGWVYAGNQGLDDIYDLTTMIGAYVVALGPSVAGVFISSDEPKQDVLLNSELTTEKYWRLPLEGSYWESMKSGVTDMVGRQWNPKVSYFGLAKLIYSEKNYVSACVMGTFGYVALEYACTGMLNEKNNVYMLVMICQSIVIPDVCLRDEMMSLKDLMIVFFETTLFISGFSLECHALLVRSNNGLLIFSLPRPPEMTTLRTRSISRAEECYILEYMGT